MKNLKNKINKWLYDKLKGFCKPIYYHKQIETKEYGNTIIIRTDNEYRIAMQCSTWEMYPSIYTLKELLWCIKHLVIVYIVITINNLKFELQLWLNTLDL